MAAERLRVGVAGAGWVAGARHLPVLMSRGDVEVVAVYDRDAKRAGLLARKVESRTGRRIATHTSFDKFVGEGLQVVHVTSSPWSHAEVTMAALSAGAHVFTEKPMAMNSAEATAMARCAAEHDRLLCVSHNFLSSRSMQDARRKLGAATVDYVAGLQLSAPSRRLPSWYRDLPAGLMFDELPHMLYTLDSLLGGGLALDHGRATFEADGHPRTVELLLRGNDGQGQVTMVFCSPVSEWHVMVSTAARVVAVDLFRDIAVSLAPDGSHGPIDIARSSLSAVAGHAAGFVRAGSRWMAKRQYWGHDVLIGQFLDSVQAEDPTPVPIESALAVVKVTDDVLDALSLRKT